MWWTDLQPAGGGPHCAFHGQASIDAPLLPAGCESFLSFSPYCLYGSFCSSSSGMWVFSVFFPLLSLWIFLFFFQWDVSLFCLFPLTVSMDLSVLLLVGCESFLSFSPYCLYGSFCSSSSGMWVFSVFFPLLSLWIFVFLIHMSIVRICVMMYPCVIHMNLCHNTYLSGTSSRPGGKALTRGRYHGGRRPSSDDSFHSPTSIPPSSLD